MKIELLELGYTITEKVTRESDFPGEPYIYYVYLVAEKNGQKIQSKTASVTLDRASYKAMNDVYEKIMGGVV
jgi:hypothetical protein